LQLAIESLPLPVPVAVDPERIAQAIVPLILEALPRLGVVAAAARAVDALLAVAPVDSVVAAWSPPSGWGGVVPPSLARRGRRTSLLLAIVAGTIFGGSDPSGVGLLILARRLDAPARGVDVVGFRLAVLSDQLDAPPLPRSPLAAIFSLLLPLQLQSPPFLLLRFLPGPPLQRAPALPFHLLVDLAILHPPPLLQTIAQFEKPHLQLAFLLVQ
jgi:hypothetical protein